MVSGLDRSYEAHKLTFGIRLMHHNLTQFCKFYPLFQPTDKLK